MAGSRVTLKGLIGFSFPQEVEGAVVVGGYHWHHHIWEVDGWDLLVLSDWRVWSHVTDLNDSITNVIGGVGGGGKIDR